MKIDFSNISQLDFSKSELMPAIVQDAHTGQILMQGFCNAEAVEKSLEIGKVTFYSRSKQRLWTKGESSENYLELVSVHTDCDQDSLLFMTLPKGPTCHLEIGRAHV